MRLSSTVCETISPNFQRITVGALITWWSYETMIAFRFGSMFFVRENEWGPTTGKHLDEVDGGNKTARVNLRQFERELGQLPI